MTDIPPGYWICACVKRDRQGNLKAIKHNPPHIKRCRVCKMTPIEEGTVKPSQRDVRPT